MATVQFFREHLLAPLAAGSDDEQRMNYTGLLSLALLGSGPDARLEFGTAQHVARYFAKEWRAPASHEAFISTVRLQLGALPDGSALLARLDERTAVALAASQRKPRVIVALIVSLVLVFVWSEISGASSDPLGLIRFGANAGALVRQGQLYRLFMANFRKPTSRAPRSQPFWHGE